MTHVDISPEVLEVWLRGFLGLCNGDVNLLLGCLVDSLFISIWTYGPNKEWTDLQAGLVGCSPFENVFLQTGNSITLGSDLLNLVSRSVGGSGVGHPVCQLPTIEIEAE